MPSPPIEAVAVLLVGDDPLARSALAALLAAEPGLAVVSHVSPTELAARDDETDLLDLLPGAPRAVLWDLGLAPGSTLDRLAAAVETLPPILALLADDEPAAEALAAGARGLLFRDAESASLAAALRAVARGLVVLDSALADLLLPADDLADTAEPATEPTGPTEPLTPREIDVLQLLAQGLSNKQIAARLEISDHTAKFHVAAILAKLGATGRTEAVVRAARTGLILL